MPTNVIFHVSLVQKYALLVQQFLTTTKIYNKKEKSCQQWWKINNWVLFVKTKPTNNRSKQRP